MRCIALAQAWQDQGGAVTFLSHCDSEAIRQRILDEGFEFIPIEKPYPDPSDLQKTLRQLSAFSFQLSAPIWLVLDGYHFTPDYQKAIKESGYRLLVIDDMAHLGHYYAEIVLNQNIHAEQLHYSCEPYTRLLLGTKYVLLRREFLKWRGWKRQIPEKAKKILVTMGGSDPDNVTLKIIRALNSLNDPELEVKIVAGPTNQNISSLENELHLSSFTFELLSNVRNMPELMAWADVAVSAGGSTCWEMAYMGVPSIILVLAENQKEVAKELYSAGVALNLGWYAEIREPELVEALTTLIFNQIRREAMIQEGKKLADGDGVARIIMYLMDRNMWLRPARKSDCYLFWKWANDPKVRAAAFSSDPIPWEVHAQWFAQKLNQSTCFLFVALDNQDTPIGQVRFDFDDKGEVEIDVSIDEHKRSRGYGSLLISMAVEKLFRETPLSKVHAFIKLHNKVSMQAFERAGFKRQEVQTIKGSESIHYVKLKG